MVAEGEKNNILAVSNPAFELFLLLHYENSYEDDIEPNTEQIIKNEKDGHQTFIYKLLLARTGINPKKNSAIGELAKNIEIAIEQEKKSMRIFISVRDRLHVILVGLLMRFERMMEDKL